MKALNIRTLLAVFLLTIEFIFSSKNVFAQNSNILSSSEIKDGWVLLFDGKTSIGWLSSDGSKFPAKGWVISNGELSTKPAPELHPTDIITEKEYSDFEFSTDFKTIENANSGIKYFFTNYSTGGLLGLEYQILDDLKNDERFGGKNGNHQCSALYDMFPASADKKLKPVGEWNTAKIVSKGKHVEHWLNGDKVLEFDRLSPEYLKALAESKYKDAVPAFGSVTKGHILLQFHGDEVSFKNIKIKTFKTTTN